MTESEAALKYLDLARGEILEKVRFVNQTLAGYLLGVAALASWAYQVIYKHTKEDLAVVDPEKTIILIGFALLLAYVALGANWLIHNNERVVAALAIFQREELAPHLPKAPVVWEDSETLQSQDGLWHAMLTITTEELIVLVPPLCAMFYALCHRQGLGNRPEAWWPLYVWLPATVVANALNCGIALLMYRTRGRLRVKG